jgi:hypothetical protein
VVGDLKYELEMFLGPLRDSSNRASLSLDFYLRKQAVILDTSSKCFETAER